MINLYVLNYILLKILYSCKHDIIVVTDKKLVCDNVLVKTLY